MSITTDGKPATPGQPAAGPATGDGPPGRWQGRAASRVPAAEADPELVERALAVATRDTDRIGELLDVLKTARLWLPLPADGKPAIRGSAVTLPTVSYLGSEFVPAYSSAELLEQLASPGAPARPAAAIPHAVVRATDLARLLPSSVGIAINAGASESVPVYPGGVSYLAAAEQEAAAGRVSLGPLPLSPDGLLASVRSGLSTIPQASQASAAWLSVEFAGEGMIISVTLDDPADAAAKDAVVAAIESAAAMAGPEDSGFPLDVTFPGEGEPDCIDEWVAAFTTPFYRR